MKPPAHGWVCLEHAMQLRKITPRDQSQHPRACNDYDEETAYESYMNPEPGFQSGPGDSVDAD